MNIDKMPKWYKERTSDIVNIQVLRSKYNPPILDRQKYNLVVSLKPYGEKKELPYNAVTYRRVKPEALNHFDGVPYVKADDS